MKKIESVQNALIKSLVQLQEKAKHRKQSGTFLIEGKREVELALKGNYELEKLFVCQELLAPSINYNAYNAKEVITLSKNVYQKLAYRESTEGILAVAKAKSLLLDDLKLSKNPLILVAESLEKPGNLGAILRTADAANIDAIIIANPKTDLYNPNLIRSSVGCVFTQQIATGTAEDVVAYLKQHSINFYSATLQNANEYHKEDYTTPTALVVGTEATGLTEIWRSQSTQNIIIPMQGTIDSMNVSVAAAILLFEAKRQRGFKLKNL